MNIGRGRKAALGLIAALAIVPSGTHAAAGAIPGKAAAKAKAAVVRAEAAAPSVQQLSAGTAGKYRNGRIPASALCPIGVGAHRLRCDAAGGFRQLSAAYAQRFGGPLPVTEGGTAGQTINYFQTPWGMSLEIISYPNGMAYEKTSPNVMWSPRTAK